MGAPSGKGVAAMTSRQTQSQTKKIGSIPLEAAVYDTGDGKFLVVPKKPKVAVVDGGLREELRSREVQRILGVGRAAMTTLRDCPVASKILRWRFTTASRKVILWDAQSVLEFKRYLQEESGK